MSMRVVYFAWFAAVALLITYGPYALRARGLDESEIGAVFSARTVASIVAQLLVVRWAERRARARLTVVAGVAGAALTSWAFVAGDALAPWFSVVVILLMSASQGPCLPLIDVAVTREHGESRFGNVRMWGSAGYGVVAGLFALWAFGADYDTAGRVAMICAAAAWTAVWICVSRVSFGSSEQTQGSQWRAPPWRLLLVTFLVLQALHWTPLMAFNTLFALHAESLAMSAAVPGLAVAAMIVAEVAGMRLFERVSRRLSLGAIFAWIGALGVVRWVLTGWTTSAWVAIAAQLINVASFGLWLPAGLMAVARFGDDEARGTLTSRFYAVTFGVGGVLGASGGAWLLERAGGATMFVVGAGCEVVAGVGLYLVMRRQLRAS